MRQRRKPSALEGELHVEMGLETDKTGEEEQRNGDRLERACHHAN